jgi:hypothetical protein
VRLPRAAHALAERLTARFPKSEYLFPIPGEFGENATVGVLKWTGFHGVATTPGFRSTFKDWPHEVWEPQPPDDVIEMAMAHTIGR